MDEQEQLALDLLKEREFEKAAKLYLQLATQAPLEEKYLISAANCYDRLGDKKLSLSLYKKALEINPQSLPALLNTSTAYYEIKKYDKSIEFAEKVLALQADNFAAHMNKANSLYALGDYAGALSCYEDMYALNPSSYNALINLANTCYNLGKFDRAAQYAEIAVDKRPTDANPLILLGNSYAELNRNNEAAASLKKASELAPESDWLCMSIANLSQKIGDWRQCLHYAWRVFGLKGGKVNADDHISFAYYLYEAHDNAKDDEDLKRVELYLKKWESAYPDNPIVHHTSCSLRDIQEVKDMDISYVKALFDGFALSFDNTLQELHYHVPELIAEGLKDNLKTKLFKKRRILDLGCGTGLCAQALLEYFPNEDYYGVDISDKMLAVAERKHIYQTLYADDIINFLESNEILFHAVISGDVLTYMGDLKNLFRLMAKTVKFNGYFVFSISKNVFNNQEYFLVPSGRFVHSLSYVQRLLKYCGFKTISIDESILRNEGPHQVQGYVVVAQKELEVVFE